MMMTTDFFDDDDRDDQDDNKEAFGGDEDLFASLSSSSSPPVPAPSPAPAPTVSFDMASLRNRLEKAREQESTLPLVVLDSMLPRQSLTMKVSNDRMLDLIRDRLFGSDSDSDSDDNGNNKDSLSSTQQQQQRRCIGMVGIAKLASGKYAHLRKGVEVEIVLPDDDDDDDEIDEVKSDNQSGSSSSSTTSSTLTTQKRRKTSSRKTPVPILESRNGVRGDGNNEKSIKVTFEATGDDSRSKRTKRPVKVS